MNPEWNTPPNGDFARYVEHLTAQMALPRPEVQQAPNVIDDVSERPRLQAYQVAAPATTPAAEAGAALGMINGKLMRGVPLVVVLLMVALHLVFNVSALVLVMAAVVIGWIAFALRGVFSGRGTVALREQIARAARQAGRRS